MNTKEQFEKDDAMNWDDILFFKPFDDDEIVQWYNMQNSNGKDFYLNFIIDSHYDQYGWILYAENDFKVLHCGWMHGSDNSFDWRHLFDTELIDIVGDVIWIAKVSPIIAERIKNAQGN